VYGLATTTLVVSVRDGVGPVWGAAFDAAQREPASIATWLGNGALAGNVALAELGARRIESVDHIHGLLGDLTT
jgi:hypothetical protein